MPRRIHRNTSQTINEESSKDIQEPQGPLKSALDYGKSWLPCLKKGISLLSGQAIVDTVGICTARAFAAMNLCPSALIPLWIKKCVPHYVSVTGRLRKLVESQLFKQPNRESTLRMVVGSGILAPLQEELERTLVMHLVKKCFVDPESKRAKITAIAVSALFFAISHYTYAVSEKFQKMALYQNNPHVRQEINSACRAFQLVYDQQVVSSFFSGLSYGIAYETTGSILAPIALHSASNMALYVSGMYTIESPANVQKMIREASVVLRKYL